jgi:glycosyltransferase involved in cell wall biosynthesis
MDISDFVKELNSAIESNKQDSVKTTVVPAQNNQNVVVHSESEKQKSKKQIKILIVSTHINQISGHSKVIMNIINELVKQDWIKVVHFGTQTLQGGDLGRKYPSNVKVIDGTALEKQKTNGFAFMELPSVILSEKPDIVFIYNELSIIGAYIEEIRKVIQNRFFRIWAYTDITYKAPHQQFIDIINRDVERIFCFTKSWKDELKSVGITRPVDVMNHGIDTTHIRHIPKMLARQNLGLPKDIFIFTSMNRNIPRKRLDILIMSFVKLIVRFPMKPIFMLVVGDKGDKGGYALFDIFARELKLSGVSLEMFGNRLLITTTNTCYKDDDINLLYNCGDVGISCSEGEGFGLCTFEQMMLGIPQIAPEINGHTEYCNEDNSQLIKPKVRYYIPQALNVVTGEACVVDTDDVSKAMERYVFDEDLRTLHGKKAKEKVSEYTWNKCCSILFKRLKSVQEEDD